MSSRASYNWECEYIENGENKFSKGMCVYTGMNYAKRFVQKRFRGTDIIRYRVTLIR